MSGSSLPLTFRGRVGGALLVLAALVCALLSPPSWAQAVTVAIVTFTLWRASQLLPAQKP